VYQRIDNEARSVELVAPYAFEYLTATRVEARGCVTIVTGI
jgi:hypothetical protein